MDGNIFTPRLHDIIIPELNPNNKKYSTLSSNIHKNDTILN